MELKCLIIEQILMSQNPEPEPKPEQNEVTFMLEKQTQMFTAPVEYEKRKRTDVFCTYLGLVFFVACIGLSYGLKNNDNVIKFKNPSDSTGKMCGIDYPQYPYLYMTHLPDISQRVCVSACPRISDDALKCKATDQVVKFTDTYAYHDHNGRFCMPADINVRKEFIRESKLESKVSFMNPVILRVYELTIGLSILLVVFLQFFPRTTMEAVQYLSLVSSIALAALIHINQSDQPGVKSFLTMFHAVSFLITLSQIIIFRQELKVNRIFVAESSKFLIENKPLVLYILFFQIILGAFFLLVLQMYSGLTSNGQASFNPKSSLYYDMNMNSYMLAITILVLFGIWGLSIIQQFSNFCISSHTLNWYFKLPNNCASVGYTFKLLFGKHIGSVIGGAFVNGFFFLPQAILDIARSCKNSKIKSDVCIFNALDLARADALSLIIITGNPYCNASKYCEYLWNQSMTTDQTQSSIRIFKLAAHVFIANVGSLIGLLIRGELDPYLLAFTLVIGLFISTFFIQFNAISSETLQLVNIMQQEFFKRREGRVKMITNVLNKGDQIKFLNQVKKIFSNQEVANEIKEIRRRYWNVQLEEPVEAVEQTKEGEKKGEGKQTSKLKADASTSKKPK